MTVVVNIGDEPLPIGAAISAENSYTLVVARNVDRFVQQTRAIYPLIAFGSYPSNIIQHIIAITQCDTTYVGYASQYPSIYEFVSFVGADPLAKYRLLDDEGNLLPDRIYTQFINSSLTNVMHPQDVKGKLRMLSQLIHFGHHVRSQNVDACRIVQGMSRKLRCTKTLEDARNDSPGSSVTSSIHKYTNDSIASLVHEFGLYEFKQ